jgi:hypothetical protein
MWKRRTAARRCLRRRAGAAVDQARLLGAVLERPARDVVVVGLVGLAEVGRVGVGNAPLPRIQCSAALVSRPPEKAMPTRSPTGKVLKDRGHGFRID